MGRWWCYKMLLHECASSHFTNGDFLGLFLGGLSSAMWQPMNQPFSKIYAHHHVVGVRGCWPLKG